MLEALVAAMLVAGQTVPEGWHEEGQPVLRAQKDASRQRGWILTANGVVVLDIKRRQTTALVQLPGWTWAGEEFTCLPDLAIGPKGEAIISSNVMSTLWRVDAQTLAVSQHKLVLDADAEMDTGFTGITYSPRLDTYFAVSDYGALWRVDPLLRRAQKMTLSAPIARTCGVSVRPTKGRFASLCVSGPQGGWTVNLAPDLRSGYVLKQPCVAESGSGL